VGCHPSVALYSLPGFLPKLLTTHPKIDVTLRHDLSRKIAEGVISAAIDVGIVVNPVRHPDLVITKLCDDEVTFWRGPGRSPLSDLRSGQAVLLCDPELAQAQWLLRQLKKAKLHPARIVASGSLEVIASLTASGAGVGLLPARVAAAASSQLKRVEGSPVFHDEICLLYRAENRGVRAIQAIGDGVKAALKS
jgi:DNA-binding transcriptional LysR family regulator